MTRTRPVRVGLVGNVVNTAHRLGEALRDDPRTEPHLFTSRGDVVTARPEAGADWIHEGRWITPATVLAPWRAPVTRRLAECDVVVAMGPGPIFAQHAGVPWCWYVTGADLTLKPFPIEFRSWYPTWRHRAGELVGGAWQRRAARRADRLWMQPFAPMVEAADRLGIALERRSDRYLPLPLDTTTFRPGAGEPWPDAAVAARMAAADLVVFHPTRLVMEETPRLVRTGQWKGNGTLLRGIAELLARGSVADPLLVLLDTELSRDRGPARALAGELGIDDHVLWVRPERGDGLTGPEMRSLYAAADVVSDEFGVGWFGYVALEGAAMGRPVVTHVDEAVMRRLYPAGHPFLGARTPGDVADRLEALADPAARERAGRAGRVWAEAHHGPAAVRAAAGDAIVELVEELAGQRRSERR